MKKVFNRLMIGSMVTSLLYVILGILLLLFPKIANEVIGYSLGGLLLVSGFLAIAKYFTNHDEVSFLRVELVFGVLSVLFGVLIFLDPLFISSMVVIVLGLWLVVNGTIKIQYALELKNYKQEYWTLALFVGLVIIFSGALVIFNPFESIMTLTMMVAVFIIAYGVLDIMELFLLKKNVDEFVKVVKVVAEVKEEKPKAAKKKSVAKKTK